MNSTFLKSAFAGLVLSSNFLFAAPLSQQAEVMSTAKKDHQSAMTKIAADSDARVQECAKFTGPYKKACTILADASHDAALEDAEIALTRAGETGLLSRADKKKSARDALRKAKVDHGIAKARIIRDNHAARAECAKLNGEDRKSCSSYIKSKTEDAKQRAQYSYNRAAEWAKSIQDK